MGWDGACRFPRGDAQIPPETESRKRRMAFFLSCRLTLTLKKELLFKSRFHGFLAGREGSPHVFSALLISGVSCSSYFFYMLFFQKNLHIIINERYDSKSIRIIGNLGKDREEAR